MRPTCLALLSVALLAVCLPCSARAEEGASEAPRPSSVPGARLYLGGVSSKLDAGGMGSGGVIGFQSFLGKGGALNSFWGVEILGVKVTESAFLPVLTGDFGLRLMPWPEGVLRPSLKGGVGISFLLILPVPSVTLSLGLGLPLGQEWVIDVAITVRRAFNLFDVNNSLTLGVLEVGVGF